MGLRWSYSAKERKSVGVLGGKGMWCKSMGLVFVWLVE
jgi:hypothetical protein